MAGSLTEQRAERGEEEGTGGRSQRGDWQCRRPLGRRRSEYGEKKRHETAAKIEITLIRSDSACQ